MVTFEIDKECREGGLRNIEMEERKCLRDIMSAPRARHTMRDNNDFNSSMEKNMQV